MCLRGPSATLAGVDLRVALVNVRSWLERHAVRLAVLACLLTAAWLSALALAKLWAVRANGLDLAIYQQVMHETARGHLFQYTIHPHLYLGDHAEFILLALVPFFLLLGGSAGALVVLQAVALAAGGLLAFRLARRALGPLPALAVVVAYLLNPTLQSVALFEFHALTLAIPLLLGLLVAYAERRYGWFVVCLALSLAVREDVGLVVAGIGVVAAVERRAWRWWLVPILAGLASFLGGVWLTGLVNPEGQYKFLRYLDWLGATPREIIVAAVHHPWRWLSRVLSVQTLALAVALLVPLFFLPLLRARWLLPILPIAVQLAVFGASGQVVAKLHYSAAFLPCFVMATVTGLAALPTARGRWRRHLTAWRPGLIMLLPVAALYFSVVLGPLVAAPLALARVDRQDVALQHAFARLVPPAAALAATFQPLAPLAARSRLFSLHYEFLGHRQLSDAPYTIPADADTLLVDLDDLLRFDLLYPENAFQGKSGAQRLDDFIGRGFRLVAWEDHLALWQRRPGPGEPLVRHEPGGGDAPGARRLGPLRYLGVHAPLNPEPGRVGPSGFTVLPVELRWSTTQTVPDDYALAFRLHQDGRRVHERFYPLGGGTYPTSRWQPGAVVVTPYRFRLPERTASGQLEASVAVVKLSGTADLDGLQSGVYEWRVESELGAVLLGSVPAGPGPATTR